MQVKEKAPTSIQKALKDLNRKAEIPWNEYLRRIIGTQPMGYKKQLLEKIEDNQIDWI